MDWRDLIEKFAASVLHGFGLLVGILAAVRVLQWLGALAHVG